MSVLDRLAKQQAARPQGGQGGRVKGIYHQWKEGKNSIRLAGDYTEVRTHFIAPAPKRSDRGLCISAAFQGDERIPQVVNCLNWDIALERPTKVKTCPICKLNAVARAVLNENPSEEEKKFFEALRQSSRASTTLKWNIIDRDDPFVLAVDDGNERKVLGYKIASVGMEAWGDIEGVFDQMGFDISDPEEGLDICVTKGHNGTRVEYSAAACIDKTTKPPSAKVTPLTAEEKQLVLHDLKLVCGKYVAENRIIDALHEDFRDLLDVNAAAADAEEPAGEDEVEEVAPKAAVSSRATTVAATKKPTAPATSSDEDEEAAAVRKAVEEEDDGLAQPSATIPIRKVTRTPVGRGTSGN
jgi:hypothetical protein